MEKSKIKTEYPRTIGDQIIFLKEKGLDIAHIRSHELILKQIGFIYLEPYFELFMKDNKFIEGISINNLEFMHNFEDDLRLQFFGGLVKIEKCVKNNLIMVLSNLSSINDPYILYKPSTYKSAEAYKFVKNQLNKKRINIPGIKHVDTSFNRLIKNSTFGVISKLYLNFNSNIQSELVNNIGLNSNNLKTINSIYEWVDTLTKVRNICAHNDRLITESDSLLKDINNDEFPEIKEINIASILYVISKLLSKIESITPEANKWRNNIEEIMLSLKIMQLSNKNFPDILKIIGFDPNHPYWKIIQQLVLRNRIGIKNPKTLIVNQI